MAATHIEHITSVLPHHTIPHKGSSSEVTTKTAAVGIGLQRPDQHPKWLTIQSDRSPCVTPPYC